MLKDRRTYEIMNAEDVGVPKSTLVLGKHSGRHAVQKRCEELGLALSKFELDRVYRQMTALADRQKHVSDAEMVDHRRGRPQPARTHAGAGRDATARPARGCPTVATRRRGRIDRPAAVRPSRYHPPVNIALLPGDGVGPEVVAAAVDVLHAVDRRFGRTFTTTSHPIGARGAAGRPAGAAAGDAAPPVRRATRCCSARSAIRRSIICRAPSRSRPDCWRCARALGVYANLRPAQACAALDDVLPFKPERVAGADLVIVRELLGGLYFGEPRGLAADGSEGFNTMRYTPAEVERVAQVRLRHRARPAPQGAVGRQGQRPRDVAAVARDGHQAGAGVSRRHARAPVRRRVRDEPGARSAPLRRRRHREPVRRHPVRRGRRHRRLARHAAVGEPRRRRRASTSRSTARRRRWPGSNVANPIGTIGSVALLLRHAFSLETEAQAIESRHRGRPRSRPPHRRHCAPRRSHGVLLGHGRRHRRPASGSSRCGFRCSFRRAPALRSSSGDPARTWQNLRRRLGCSEPLVVLGALVQAAPAPSVTLPAQPLRFGAFTARFDPAGTFTHRRQGWPKLEGTWTMTGSRDRAADAVGAEGMRRAGALSRRAAAGGHPTFAADRGSAAVSGG